MTNLESKMIELYNNTSPETDRSETFSIISQLYIGFWRFRSTDLTQKVNRPFPFEMSTSKKEPRPDPKVTVGSLSDLFSTEAKTFKLRKDSPSEEKHEFSQPVKDWKQIAFDFLNQPFDIVPLGEPQTFEEIDTIRGAEFVAGRGTQKWNELRKEGLNASKEKRRRSGVDRK
jgi:hypothetical protein